MNFTPDSLKLILRPISVISIRKFEIYYESDVLLAYFSTLQFIDQLISDETVDFQVLVKVTDLFTTRDWCKKVLFVSKKTQNFFYINLQTDLPELKPVYRAAPPGAAQRLYLVCVTTINIFKFFSNNLSIAKKRKTFYSQDGN